MAGNGEFSNTSVSTGVASCASEVRLECRYDDPWRTPITNAPVRIEDNSGVVLPGKPGGPTTRALVDFGLQDGDAAVPSYRAELGTFPSTPVQSGTIRMALVADLSAQSEVDALSEQIIAQLDGFKSEMEEALLPWITQWNEQGILSIPEAYRTGAVRGLSEWWKGEVGFWTPVGNWISEAFDAAINAAKQAAVELWEWYDNLPWYDKLNPIGAYAREQLLSLWEGANDLWERREQIMALVKGFVAGSVEAIEKGLEALVDLPGEAGEIIKLLVEKSAEWIQGLIEMIRETDVLEKLAGTVFAIIMMMTPNLWAEARGAIEGYLLPEVLIAVIFLIIAALTEGAGAPLLVARLTAFASKIRTALAAAGKIGPLLLKIFSKLDEIAKLITKLAKALRRKIGEFIRDTNGSLKIIRSSRKIDQKLLDELAEKRIKHTPEDIVAIQKLDDGRIVFIEKGSESAGLQHILNHADEFNSKGITNDMIPDFIMKNLEEGKLIGYQGKGTGRPIYELIYNGKKHHTAITTGNNGFVVGANPVSVK